MTELSGEWLGVRDSGLMIKADPSGYPNSLSRDNQLHSLRPVPDMDTRSQQAAFHASAYLEWGLLMWFKLPHSGLQAKSSQAPHQVPSLESTQFPSWPDSNLSHKRPGMK